MAKCQELIVKWRGCASKWAPLMADGDKDDLVVCVRGFADELEAALAQQAQPFNSTPPPGCKWPGCACQDDCAQQAQPWPMSDAQGCAIVADVEEISGDSYSHKVLTAKHCVESAVRLGFVVPPQQAQPDDDCVVVDAEGVKRCITCLGALPTPKQPEMPTREMIAEAMFNASMPHGLSVTWAKLTDLNVRDQNTRVIEARLQWADAVLALFAPKERRCEHSFGPTVHHTECRKCKIDCSLDYPPDLQRRSTDKSQ